LEGEFSASFERLTRFSSDMAHENAVPGHKFGSNNAAANTKFQKFVQEEI